MLIGFFRGETFRVDIVEADGKLCRRFFTLFDKYSKNDESCGKFNGFEGRNLSCSNDANLENIPQNGTEEKSLDSHPLPEILVYTFVFSAYLFFLCSLVKIDLFGNGFSTHVARFQWRRTIIACTVTAKERHVASSFHAYAAHIRLFQIRYSRFEITQSLQVFVLVSLTFTLYFFHAFSLPLFRLDLRLWTLHATQTRGFACIINTCNDAIQLFNYLFNSTLQKLLAKKYFLMPEA